METVKDGNIYKAVKQVERQYWKRETVTYPEGVAKFESSTAGNYSVDLLDGEYEIICVGGGGGGVVYHSSAIHKYYTGGGGSGGYSNTGNINLVSDTYSITVGNGGSKGGQLADGTSGGNSLVGSVCLANGGGGGKADGPGGAGGTGTTSNGNNGGYNTGSNPSASGGASVYGGYGAGGSANKNSANDGGSGYVKVTCYSEETIVPGTADDYDFYTDETTYKGVNI